MRIKHFVNYLSKVLSGVLFVIAFLAWILLFFAWKFLLKWGFDQKEYHSLLVCFTIVLLSPIIIPFLKFVFNRKLFRKRHYKIDLIINQLGRVLVHFPFFMLCTVWVYLLWEGFGQKEYHFTLVCLTTAVLILGGLTILKCVYKWSVFYWRKNTTSELALYSMAWIFLAVGNIMVPMTSGRDVAWKIDQYNNFLFFTVFFALISLFTTHKRGEEGDKTT